MQAFAHFLKNEYIPLLKKLEPRQKGLWGKMDAQQMVEHMRDIFKVANGKFKMPLMDDNPVHLEKKRAFLLTDFPFPQNAKGPGVPDEPIPHRAANMEEAIARLEPEIDAMFAAYDTDPSLLLMHPAFGELDYDRQLRYLSKHVYHHLRQFGLAD